MPSDNVAPRSINIQSVHVLKQGQDPRDINWQTDGELSIEAFEGSTAWYGRLPLATYRKDYPRDGVQRDISGFDESIKLLRPVTKHELYPKFAHDITQYQQNEPGDDGVYFKAPRVAHHRDGSHEIATRLLREAHIHETILRNPHRSLGSYIDAVEEDGLLVRLVFKKLDTSLHDRVDAANPETMAFTELQRSDCMDQVAAAAAHLHSLGVAHNDISPSNIMIDGAGQAVLIDFDACAPLGEPLTKGGLVTGWKGPLAGEGPTFTESSAECDIMAIQEIRVYLDLRAN